MLIVMISSLKSGVAANIVSYWFRQSADAEISCHASLVACFVNW
jgi:hypothetical protein